MSQALKHQAGGAVRGALTGVALGDAEGLFLPPAADAFGLTRRPLTARGMKLSLELARMAYTLDIEPWMRAGWTDFSIQVDNQLITDLTAREDENFADRRLSAIGSLRLTRARMALREYNPLAQVTGALRQRGESDTIKAVAAALPVPGGRFVVAVGFMGTGARFYDWFSNFRAGTKDGFHKGFSQLTQAFIKNEAQILFPDTAEALGREKLTLADILVDMRSGDGRFSLWMAGHSQGAAVMQVYCDYLLRVKRVPRAGVVGCGFASPTIAADNAVADGASYPLWHIVNADDLVPRMGSLRHFGLCLQYAPDARFRDLAYGWNQTPEDRRARRNARLLSLYVADTPSFLVVFTALLQVICEEKTDEEIFGGQDGILFAAPFEKAFSFAGRKAKERLEGMIRYMRGTYRELSGADMDGAALRFLAESFRPVVKSMPLKRLLGALYDCLYPPHSLCRGERGDGAYARIVNERSGMLKPFIWQDGPAALPYRRYAEGFYAFENARPARRARLPVRHGPRRRRAIQARR